ncbi:MAG: TSUP family transporter [Massiliimalia sp.]|jgi:uncharacterized membrane protein YfcA
MNLLWYSIGGFFAGLTASMGLGGGFILLILLTFFTTLGTLESQLLNLTFFLPISAVSVFLHWKHKLIEKEIVKKSILYGIIGVIIGLILSQFLPEQLLRKLFGAFVLLIGTKELLHRKNSPQHCSKKTADSQ